MKRFLVLACCLVLAACTTTNVKTAVKGPKPPPAGAKVLLVQPDVELSILTLAGLTEPRADWTKQGRDNIQLNVESQLKTKSHVFRTLNPDEAMEGKVGQLLRLHEAVGMSIMMFDYGFVSLPTKKDKFDWTLGEGAQALGQTYDADYALFTFARGSYSSGARVAAAAVGAAFGVGIATGSQQAFASLVDLRTGQVVWFNVAAAGPGADMRDEAGSKALVASLLKGAPL